jgi:hypothetical protein
MKRNIQPFLFCPVPDEQKPINQYIDLKEIIGPMKKGEKAAKALAVLEKKKGLIIVLMMLLSIVKNIFSFFFYFFSFFFFFSSFLENEIKIKEMKVFFSAKAFFLEKMVHFGKLYLEKDEILNYLMIGASGAIFFMLINFLFFYFIPGKEIQKRFYQSYLIYEESSWYNSEIWKKPISLIKSDRFLGSQLYFFLNKKKEKNFPFFLFLSLNRAFLLRKKIRN